MIQKSILITGCSSGIGRDAAMQLHALGWRVFATCRKESDCRELREKGVDSLVLDYEDEQSIQTALATVLTATGGRLDALFNNGAYAIPGPVEDIPRDALRAIFEANFFGQFDLINQVIPVMRAQGHGRIINCSSVLGLVSVKWRGAYTATKFAMEGMTDALRLEMQGTGIHVSLIEPGAIESKFRTNAVKQFEKWIDWEGSARADQYRAELLNKLYKGSGAGAFQLQPAAVTKKLIHALESQRPKPRYYVTTPTYVVALLKRLLSTRAFDRVVGRG